MVDANQNTDRHPEGKGTEGRAGDGPRNSRAACSPTGILALLGQPGLIDQLIEDRAVEFRNRYRPEDGFADWLVHDLAPSTVQIDIKKAQLIRDEARVFYEVQFNWDDQRKSQAFELGVKIRRSPCSVVLALEQTLQGVDYLLTYWRGLRCALTNHGVLDEDQHQRLFDLLGVAVEHRASHDKVPAASDGLRLKQLVAHHIERLEKKRAVDLVERDRLDRERRLAGSKPVFQDQITRDLKSDLRHAEKCLRWALSLLEQSRKAAAPEAGCDPPPSQPQGRPSQAKAGSGSSPAPESESHSERTREETRARAAGERQQAMRAAFAAFLAKDKAQQEAARDAMNGAPAASDPPRS